MKTRTVALASILACALALAPVSSAFAAGRHHGGHFGGGPIFGFAGAIVATAAAIVTAPIAILSAVAQAPYYYYPQGPAYSAAPPVYYNPPPAGPAYYGNAIAAAPAYFSPPQPAPYYAPSPAPAAQPQSQGDWYYCADSNSYYPYVRTCPAGWQRVPAQPPDANDSLR